MLVALLLISPYQAVPENKIFQNIYMVSLSKLISWIITSFKNSLEDEYEGQFISQIIILFKISVYESHGNIYHKLVKMDALSFLK